MLKRRPIFAEKDNPDADSIRQQNLEALIAPRQVAVQDLPIDLIQPNPYQARQHFDNIEELALAIREQGFVSRLRVRPLPGDEQAFQLVFGERRLRAARMAGLTTIPCEIAQHSDEELIEIGLAENIQRRDLTPLEEAQAFRIFIDHRGYSIRKLAERIGKDKSYIEDRLKLLTIPADVQEMVELRHDSVQAAREIAKIDSPEKRQSLIEGVIKGELTKADVREIVRETQSQSAHKEHMRPDSAAVQDNTQSATATRVLGRTIDRDAAKIRILLQQWQQQCDQHEARAMIRVNLEEIMHMCQSILNETSPG